MFNLEEVEKMTWNKIILNPPQYQVEEFKCLTTQTRKGECLGIFPNKDDPNPCVIFVITQNFSHDVQTWWENQESLKA